MQRRVTTRSPGWTYYVGQSRAALGSLDRVKRIVEVLGMVNSTRLRALVLDAGNTVLLPGHYDLATSLCFADPY